MGYNLDLMVTILAVSTFLQDREVRAHDCLGVFHVLVTGTPMVAGNLLEMQAKSLHLKWSLSTLVNVDGIRVQSGRRDYDFVNEV